MSSTQSVAVKDSGKYEKLLTPWYIKTTMIMTFREMKPECENLDMVL